MKKGSFKLKIKIVYLDELGNSRFCEPEPITLIVKELVEPDRIYTGTKELDAMLFGGLPKNYAVALTAPPNDERELIVKNFLEIGIKNEQITFYITTEPTDLSGLLPDPPSNFYLFVCNPNPKANLPNHPNIHWLRSKIDVNNLNIALVRAYRITDQSENVKRIVLENISDILLHFGAETTRKWLSGLIREATEKGFTLMALINPMMHQPEQLHAILDIFDGEISLYETEDPYECKRFVRVRKLRNQNYIKNPICLTERA
jgi:KaiC/GvpD/RAD55 family RecA-like ATPase